MDGEIERFLKYLLLIKWLKETSVRFLYRYFLPCWTLSSIFLKFICLKQHVNFVVCWTFVRLVQRNESEKFSSKQGEKKLLSLSTLFNNYDCKRKYKGMKIPGQSRTITRFHSKFNWLILSFFFSNSSMMEYNAVIVFILNLFKTWLSYPFNS